MIKAKFNEIKQGQRLRKQYGERAHQAQKELQKKLGSAPRLSEADRVTVKKYMVVIQKHNAFTFKFIADLEEHGLEYSSTKVIWSGQYEHANREAMELKKEIKRILDTYLIFWHEEPDPETLIFYRSKKHRYSNPDKEVLSLLEEMSEMRNSGEEEAYQMKKIGVNFASLLHVSNEELDG